MSDIDKTQCEGEVRLIAMIVIQAVKDLTHNDMEIKEDAYGFLTNEENKGFITFFNLDYEKFLKTVDRIYFG